MKRRAPTGQQVLCSALQKGVTINHRREKHLKQMLERMGFARNRRVRLYDEEFELVGDPIFAAEKLVLIDARENKSGRVRRVRIPNQIVEQAEQRLTVPR